jgi:peptidoglycan/xylan/chitin deacetylase (PgdA/CDA1 family)
VSLTFDDALAEQKTAADILHKHGLNGTFYINSGTVGKPHYFEQGNLKRLASLGHEIGGHSASHLDLTTLPADDARREVCADRATLTGWGFRVTSFAYPYASHNRAIETIVQDCGYNSARKDGGIRRPRISPESCPRCPVAETIPPADPYTIRTPHEIDTSWTLADMKSVVTNAEDHGGGWVVLVFHHMCDDRCPLSTSPAILDAFAAWLKSREARGTQVKTVDHVIEGSVKPIVTPASTSQR